MTRACRRIALLLCACAALPQTSVAQTTLAPETSVLVSQNSHAFSYTSTTLEGAGAEFLRTQTARSQFVLLGEEHLDHAIPIFAGALYRMLHDRHGFRSTPAPPTACTG